MQSHESGSENDRLMQCVRSHFHTCRVSPFRTESMQLSKAVFSLSFNLAAMMGEDPNLEKGNIWNDTKKKKKGSEKKKKLGGDRGEDANIMKWRFVTCDTVRRSCRRGRRAARTSPENFPKHSKISQKYQGKKKVFEGKKKRKGKKKKKNPCKPGKGEWNNIKNDIWMKEVTCSWMMNPLSIEIDQLPFDCVHTQSSRRSVSLFCWTDILFLQFN